MSIIDNSNSINKAHNFDIAKITKELCLMTGCDQELATLHLMNYNFDIQIATEKVLESLNNVTQVDDGWQTINRHKKFKKKEPKNGSYGMNGDNVKMKINFNHNGKNRNYQPGNFKNDERQNYTRPRYKKNMNTKTSTDEFEHLNNCKLRSTDNVNIVPDLNDEELRWDNLADIEGGLKESGTNSIADCFYSDDEFGFVQSVEDTYQDVKVNLIAEVDNHAKININDENSIKLPEKTVKNIDDPLNEYLSQQLPIFGKFSKTDPPKPVPVILNKPVSFVMPFKFLNKCSKMQYNFGVDISELLSTQNSVDLKFMISHDNSVLLTKQSDRDNVIDLNILDNKLPTSNNPNFNNVVLQNAMSKATDYEGILNTILKQQQEVAILFGQHPAQSYCSYTKPINIIPISNSSSIGPVYSMQMNPENLHKDIENGLIHQNPDCFLQNSFPTSINVSVPFHLAKK